MISEFQVVESRLGGRFLADFADKLVSDPKVAIVEIISNCSDAGADLVEIEWPHKNGGDLSVLDNGTGMTFDEFVSIWPELPYTRHDAGADIVFPDGNKTSNRKLYGVNGKGRLSLFCFDSEYRVETWKQGESSAFVVRRQDVSGRSVFDIEPTRREPVKSELHGLKISCKAYFNHIPLHGLKELIGAKFVADPSFEIRVNGEAISLTDLRSAQSEIVPSEYGVIQIYLLDSRSPGRTSQHHGVAWHVHNKVVGKIEWRDPNGLISLDARTSEAKRYSFVAVVDILADSVKTDWTGFRETEKTVSVLRRAGEYIQAKLDDLFYEKRLERKQLALKDNNKELKKLSESSMKRINNYVDRIQTEVRTIDQKTLNATVKLFANMEQALTGYGLIHQLSQVSPDDIDTLHEILAKWSVRDARVVLDELGARLSLIKELEKVVGKKSDELHEIHPLFERGLWIMGPSYERADYISNSWLLTVLRKFFEDKGTMLDHEQRRPDLVVLPESRVRLFSCDKENSDTGMHEIEKVVVLELKRGKIKQNDIRQAEDYAYDLSTSDRVTPRTVFQCFVIGSDIHQEAGATTRNKNILVNPIKYGEVIHNASKRTFHLMERIRDLGYPYYDDED